MNKRASQSCAERSSAPVNMADRFANLGFDVKTSGTKNLDRVPHITGLVLLSKILPQLIFR